MRTKVQAVLSVMFLCAGLVACYPTGSPEYSMERSQHQPIDLQKDLVLEGPLADCKAYGVYRFGGTGPIVIRCPNSTTVTSQTVGKTRVNVVTIDGVEYAPVKKEP